MLREAVIAEDQLNNDEPTDWFFSVRHHFGNMLIKAGEYSEAERIYRQDLKKLKRNGWALIGFQNALEGQKKSIEADVIKNNSKMHGVMLISVFRHQFHFERR